MLEIVVRRGPSEERRLRFSARGTLGIGRSAGNEIQIRDGRISGLHGQLVARDAGWAYRDLESTNGSIVVRGDERIPVDGARSFEVVLDTGDALWLGDSADPVVLEVNTIEAPAEVAEGTIVARRAMETADELSRALVEHAGATALVALLRDVGCATDPSEVLRLTGDFLLRQIASARRVVLVTDSEPAWGITQAGGAPVALAGEPPPYPRGLVAQAKSAREAVLSTEAPTVSDHSLQRLEASAAIAVPLMTTGAGTVGVLVVDARAGGFAAHDLDLCVALGHQVANALATSQLVRRLRSVERRLRDENRYLRAAADRDDTFGEIIGDSPAMREVFANMRVVMDTDATVLVTGETGTGKELVARALHDKSKRKGRLFAAVNCAALAENLLESELFGHVKGAFTGASERKPGLFQVADGGTLFLDELGELSVGLQAKLLRVLQEGEILPVGATRPIRVDVRVVAATHRDLKALAKEGRFREDLYYRINVFPIRLPALRERGGDVAALADFFVTRYARRFGKRVSGLTEAAVERLTCHAWPGNIRELENELQRAVLLTPDGRPVDAPALSDEVRGTGTSTAALAPAIEPGESLKQTMDRLEREVLRRALEDRGWNRSATARDLSISRQALLAKLQKHDLKP